MVEASNPPQNIDTYDLKGKEVKMVRSKCNAETGEFLGLYETIGFLVVRGNPEDIFLNYGFHKEKSKITKKEKSPTLSASRP